MNRKIISILLFLSFTAPVASTFIYLKYQKAAVKKKVKWAMIDGMDRDLLVLLKFTEEEKEKDLNWEHSREFEYRGEMYDIVESETKGDTTLYWCWEDKEETQLNAQLNNLLAQTLGNNPENRENGKKVQSFFKTLYFSDTCEMQVTPFREIKMNFYHKPDFFKSHRHSPPAPPPDKA